VEGRRCGQGRESRRNGDIYEGSWVDDKMQGKGVQTVQEGNDAGIYVGDFHQDVKNGRGTFTSSKG
jgi:hypothetical protein